MIIIFFGSIVFIFFFFLVNQLLRIRNQALNGSLRTCTNNPSTWWITSNRICQKHWVGRSLLVEGTMLCAACLHLLCRAMHFVISCLYFLSYHFMYSLSEHSCMIAYKYHLECNEEAARWIRKFLSSLFLSLGGS